MARIALLTALLALAFPAAASAFDAHGSARQVYVTGAKPGTKATVGAPAGAAAGRARSP